MVNGLEKIGSLNSLARRSPRRPFSQIKARPKREVVEACKSGNLTKRIINPLTVNHFAGRLVSNSFVTDEE